ncbi:MAG: hypothetical protein U9N52_12780 [Campylobacterota bacterium]|nr:hypothetical protein [Campylobacterota bacterium]
MQRLAYWLTPIIAIGVALFLVLLLYRINQGEAPPLLQQKPIENRVTSDQMSDDNGWLERFSKSERLGYFFPVNEIYINVDLNQKIVQETIYQLKAIIHDPYQLFCLKEELKQYGFKHLLKKDTTGTVLFIRSKNREKLTQLVDALKNYQILASIVPFKEEKRWKNIK